MPAKVRGGALIVTSPWGKADELARLCARSLRAFSSENGPITPALLELAFEAGGETRLRKAPESNPFPTGEGLHYAWKRGYSINWAESAG